MEGKYKWLRFEGRENKMFCEIWRAILPRIGTNNFQTDSLKARICMMGPLKDMLWPTFKKMEFLFNTVYYMYIVYLKLLFFIFPQLCSLQRKNGLSLGNTCMYMNNHACKEISKHNYLSYLQDRSRGFLSIMADGATDVSCLELEIVYAGFEMTTLQLQKES